MATTQAILDKFERALVVSAVGLAFIVKAATGEGLACVLASGVFVALNFRLWRLIVAVAHQFPYLIPVAIMFKLPLLVGGVFLLTKLGAPWMVGVGVSNFFIAAMVMALPLATTLKPHTRRVSS